ncbi:formimidoylglutamase [Flavobacteriaceae bacterium TP-CH-4]|uniref:Formimidoylglutamase n=1 Tax=Pelagihabitans pacificus TaxID=2696054 RepID=A0A967ECN6_9FLAO|nr:formimidoylglutamase [Pelagihabitans pacificus]NHF58473.1 formimidoylglutamase [Pelagihabitans pacificus]
MTYKKTSPEIYKGRSSKEQLYLHEKLICLDFQEEIIKKSPKKTIVLLGYACDEGVKRNQGRTGTVSGPDAIRGALGKMPNHLSEGTRFLDVGTIGCLDGDLEATQTQLCHLVDQLLEKGVFPVLLGGGHDIAYGHFNGIKKHRGPQKAIGIINFDAHFDLRDTTNGNNSGTPFYQIAQDCKKEGSEFRYFCLGIRQDANDPVLYKTAEELQVHYLERHHFQMHYLEHVQLRLIQFIEDVDCLYVTVDLDGFSTAYAPGVSAPSAMGFSPDIVLECLKLIIDSRKLISIDFAEMNPAYDIDDRTAKLAASLIHFVIHRY